LAPGEGIEEDEVLDLISGLVDKSLVVAEATGEGEVRYGMLEPVRQYARERLEESGGQPTSRADTRRTSLRKQRRPSPS
jgi:predicted ATPase